MHCYVTRTVLTLPYSLNVRNVFFDSSASIAQKNRFNGDVDIGARVSYYLRQSPAECVSAGVESSSYV
jgi:hypothetical protein